MCICVTDIWKQKGQGLVHFASSLECARALAGCNKASQYLIRGLILEF